MSKISYKFILIGNSGVGKTAIFHKMQSGKFYDQNISTIGVAKKNFFFTVEVQENGKNVKKILKFLYMILQDKKNSEQLHLIIINHLMEYC